MEVGGSSLGLSPVAGFVVVQHVDFTSSELIS
jgi:hypothetical protein